jgi:predicted nucleotidyltransferase
VTSREALRKIADSYSLSEIYAFGSRAAEAVAQLRDTPVRPAAPRSDLDIGVRAVSGRRLDARERARLCVDLEDLFSFHRVDLVVLPEADPFLALEAIRGELLYARDLDAEAEYELYVLRRAGDLAPFARERWERALRDGEGEA